MGIPFVQKRYLSLIAAFFLIFLLGRHSHKIAEDWIPDSSVLQSSVSTGFQITGSPVTKAPKPPKVTVEDWTGVDITKIPEYYHYNEADMHRHLYSVSTIDRKYFFIDFTNGNEGYNANIIPHKTLNDTWIIVAQQKEHSVSDSVWWAEWVCNAQFVNGKLACVRPPTILPIAATFGTEGMCPAGTAMMAMSMGPHDARVFYGPEFPMAIYGSNSKFCCMGQWIQDFRILFDWGLEPLDNTFKSGTELQRPDDYNFVEKNWFVFWDNKGDMYVHHDVYPKRVFAKLNLDGSVGNDLGPTAIGDAECQARFMPYKAEVLQGIHQATNSLSITLCERADPSCVPNDENTFVFHIFQHKSYYSYHGNYEPFVMTFYQRSPFEIHAIAGKPIWIHGRTPAGPGNRPQYLGPDESYNDEQSEMLYITSMSWQKQGQKYHGYIDDILFLAFGLEDRKTAGIDVVAGDLFKDLNLCSNASP